MQRSYMHCYAGNWSGFLSDVRLYSEPLAEADVSTVYNASFTVYNQTALQVPSQDEIKRTGRGWKTLPITPVRPRL